MENEERWTKERLLDYQERNRLELQAFVDEQLALPGAEPVKQVQALEMLNGDPSFAKTYLTNLAFTMAAGRGPDAFDCTVLTLVIARIVNSTTGLGVVAGSAGKAGAPRKGAKGLAIAQDVSRQLTAGISVEDAWERVAEQERVSASLVKQYWIEWKPVLRQIYGEILDGMPVPERDALIAFKLRDKK